MEESRNTLDAVELQVKQLKQQIATTEAQLADLQKQLNTAEAVVQVTQLANKANSSHAGAEQQQDGLHSDDTGKNKYHAAGTITQQWPLDPDEYHRYGRQLIMPEIGLQGQLRLKSSRVLIVGAGGLGCPAAAYLAGAGVGTLGLIDGDVVEASNLHRQILHSTSRIGSSKVDSAIAYLRDLNPLVRYEAHARHLTSTEAVSLVSRYDLVLDCTDQPASRYLVSDACVLAGKPLVSASALRTDGQLIVLNDPPSPPGGLPHGGPCYRCVWPVPPPPEAVLSCGDGGILGPVVGVMGVLQALEAIKILSRPPPPGDAGLEDKDDNSSRPTLLVFSAFSTPPFRSVRMRSRRPDCIACSAKATISRESLASGSLDYAAFCGALNPVDILEPKHRISATDFARSRLSATSETPSPVIVDVRSAVEFGICSLPGSINVPWSDFPTTVKEIRNSKQPPTWVEGENLVLVCRRGNDSQLAVKMLRDADLTRGDVVDVRGGFTAWRRDVDRSWPNY